MATPRKPARRQAKTLAGTASRAIVKRATYTDRAPPILTRRGLPVDAVPAAELKNRLGSVLRKALTNGVVAITRHHETYAMVLSVEEYRTLLSYAPPALKTLEKEFDALVREMRSKKSVRAAKSLFNITPEQFRRAAHQAANEKKKSKARWRRQSRSRS